MWLLTFNVFLGYQGTLFWNFLWLFFDVFFFQSDRPTQYQETHSTLNKKGDGLISNLILGQIIVSNLTHVHKLNSRINYARLHYIRYKKQTSNAISTQAYNSRCSFWKVTSKASIASHFSTLLRIKQGEKRKWCHLKSDFGLWQATYFSTKNPTDKLAINNRRLSW